MRHICQRASACARLWQPGCGLWLRLPHWHWDWDGIGWGLGDTRHKGQARAPFCFCFLVPGPFASTTTALFWGGTWWSRASKSAFIGFYFQSAERHFRVLFQSVGFLISVPFGLYLVPFSALVSWLCCLVAFGGAHDALRICRSRDLWRQRTCIGLHLHRILTARQ
jgi:hypothetical protein